MTLPGPAAQLVEWIVADSIDSLRGGSVPFAPHLMVLGGEADPRERTLHHTRFGPDLAEGLDQARASVGPTTAGIAYAIAWDGFATVDGERGDAVLVEVGTADERDAWLLAQPYRTVTRRFRGTQLDRHGDLLEVDRPGSRLADVLPAWPGRIELAGRVHELAWTSSPTPGHHKAEYVPAGQSIEAFTDMVLLELDTRSPGAQAWAATLLDVLAGTELDVVHREATDDGSGGVLVEFLLRTEAFAEWNAQRYVDHPLGVVMVGAVRRSADGTGPADREAVLSDLRAMPVPALRGEG